MGFTIREIDADCKFSQALTIDVLERAIPPQAIDQALAHHQIAANRERRLRLVVTIWLVIALHLYPSVSIGGVLRKLARGLRFIWPDPSIRLPRDSAIAYRRAQVGAQPIVTLFHSVCQPIATEQTRGAFLFGLRLMAVDGTTEDVPDTPANPAVFGRHTSARGASAFRQVQAVYLAECGTHVLSDAGLWPCHTSERNRGFRLLRSLRRGMLLMWDRGFHDFDMVVATRRGGAHVLSRLPAGVQPVPLRSLPDGSILAYLLPSQDARRRRRLYADALRRGATPSPASLALAAWTMLITNVPAERLTVQEALVVARTRWQIELLFKLWKSHGRIDESRSEKPWRILCELYAKLLAMLVQHWILVVCCWCYPDRSLTKAAQTIRRLAFHLACILRDADQLTAALAIIADCLSIGCRINKRKAVQGNH